MGGEELTTALVQYEDARACEQRGDLNSAAVGYENTLRLDPDFAAARRPLAVLLVRLGRQKESLQFFRAELQAGSDGEKWLSNLIVEAMQRPNLTLAGDLAAILTTLQRGSEWHTEWPCEPLTRIRDAQISLAKLRHDIDQFRYLRKTGALDDGFDEIIQGYVDTVYRLDGLGNNGRVPRPSRR